MHAQHHYIILHPGNCATDQCETQSLAPSTLSVDSSSNIDFPIHSGHFQRRFSQSYYESSHLQKFSTLGHSSVFSTSFHHSNPYTTGKFATLTAKAGQKFKKNLTKKVHFLCFIHIDIKKQIMLCVVQFLNFVLVNLKFLQWTFELVLM